jgi:hypothetical protein
MTQRCSNAGERSEGDVDRVDRKADTPDVAANGRPRRLGRFLRFSKPMAPRPSSDRLVGSGAYTTLPVIVESVVPSG